MLVKFGTWRKYNNLVIQTSGVKRFWEKMIFQNLYSWCCSWNFFLIFPQDNRPVPGQSRWRVWRLVTEGTTAMWPPAEGDCHQQTSIDRKYIFALFIYYSLTLLPRTSKSLLTGTSKSSILNKIMFGLKLEFSFIIKLYLCSLEIWVIKDWLYFFVMQYCKRSVRFLEIMSLTNSFKCWVFTKVRMDCIILPFCDFVSYLG